MSNREEWTRDDWALKAMMDKIREEDPDFWKEFDDRHPTIDTQRESAEREARERKLRRRNRRRIIAACFAAVCILSVGLAIFWTSDTAHAMRFEMEKKYYQSKGWIQATDPEKINENNVISMSICEQEQLHRIKEIWEYALEPNYIPNGYEFREVYIEKYLSGIVFAHYEFSNNERSINILLRTYDPNEEKAQIWIKSMEVCNGKYKYHLWDDTTTNVNGLELIYDDKVMISILGKETEDELIKIANSLQ